MANNKTKKKKKISAKGLGEKTATGCGFKKVFCGEWGTTPKKTP